MSAKLRELRRLEVVYSLIPKLRNASQALSEDVLKSVSEWAASLETRLQSEVALQLRESNTLLLDVNVVQVRVVSIRSLHILDRPPRPHIPAHYQRPLLFPLCGPGGRIISVMLIGMRSITADAGRGAAGMRHFSRVRTCGHSHRQSPQTSRGDGREDSCADPGEAPCPQGSARTCGTEPQSTLEQVASRPIQENLTTSVSVPAAG